MSWITLRSMAWLHVVHVDALSSDVSIVAGVLAASQLPALDQRPYCPPRPFSQNCLPAAITRLVTPLVDPDQPAHQPLPSFAQLNMRGDLPPEYRTRHPTAPGRVQWVAGVLLPQGVNYTNGSWSPRWQW